MATHVDDEEQVENLKRWWRENWLALVVGLAIGFGAIGGWQGYQSWRGERAANASRMYDDLKKSLDAGKADEAEQIGKKLKDDYAGTPYAAAGALLLARSEVDGGKLDEAIAELGWAREHAPDDGMRRIAALRLAQVQWQKGEADAALATLDGEAGAFAPLYEELRGDILLSKGDRDAARSAYRKALDAAGGDSAANHELLQQKFDDLAMPTAEASPATPQPEAKS